MKFPFFNWLRAASPKPRQVRRIDTKIAQLESRVMLSGNVAAVVDDGDLELRGDDRNNQVEVALENGNVVVRGLNGTRINGADSFVAFRNTNRIPDDLVVRLKRGNDTLIVSDGVVIGDDLKVRDRSGATTVGLNGVVIGDDLRIRTGRRDDRISVEGSRVGDDVRIHTHRGDDLVAFLDTTVGDSAKARTGGGDDDLVFQELSVQDKLRLSTGWGDDDVVVEDSHARRLRVKTRRGDDFLFVNRTHVAKSTRVKMSPGDDLFVQEDSNLQGRRKRSATPVRPADVAPSILQRHLTDPQTGAVARAEALRDELKALTGDVETPDPPPTPAPPTVTFDLSANADITQSNGTLLTTLDTITISGETTAFAEVEAGQPGGTFPAVTTTADENGQYVVDVGLNVGQQTVVIRATDAFDQSAETEFDIHRAVGTVVRYSSTSGTFDVELLDDDAPNTVENFLNYDDRYDGSIIHRSAHTSGGDDFIVQGGGFDLVPPLQPISTDAPVANEFDPANSNVRGTLSMALPPGSPDAGTSQWFFNVADNSFLDAAMHTVFGRVIGTGMDVVDAIHALPTFNLVAALQNTALRTVPLDGGTYEPFSEAITGTVTTVSGSTSVTGTGTLFQTELGVGANVEIDGVVYVVSQIVSDTSLVLQSGAQSTASDVTALINPAPADEEYVQLDIDVLLTPPP